VNLEIPSENYPVAPSRFENRLIYASDHNFQAREPARLCRYGLIRRLPTNDSLWITGSLCVLRVAMRLGVSIGGDLLGGARVATGCSW